MREEEIRRLAYEIYLKRGKEDGHDHEDWKKAEKNYRFYITGWAIVSLLTFVAYLLLIYFNANLVKLYVSVHLLLSTTAQNLLETVAIILMFIAGGCFYWCVWRFVDEKTFAKQSEPRPINQFQRDIHEARYNHLNAEITRYRDLVWKITLSVWGIYYSLIRLAEGFKIPPVSIPNPPKFSLPIGWFLIFCVITALIATIFHAFCEIMVVRNQQRRRSLEAAMGLLDPNWAHQKTLEDSGRIGFLFSVIVFGVLIWAPPLIMLVLWANRI